MTIKRDILEAFRKNPTLTPKALADKFGFNRNTVRGRFSEFRSEGIPIPRFRNTRKGIKSKRPIKQRADKGRTKWNRKLAKVGGSERNESVIAIFAVTYEKNKTNRRNELEDAILDYIGDNGLFIGNNSIGYEVREGKGTPEYPEIEVGEE